MMISAYNLLQQDRDRLRDALKRLNDWALKQQEDFMCPAGHPIAQAAAALSSSWGWSRSDALLAEFKETVAKFDAAKGVSPSELQEFRHFPKCKCPMDPGPEPWCAIGLPHRG